jgi:parallel beta-helix repeat protein
MNEDRLERALRDWASREADLSEPSRLRSRILAVPESAEAHTGSRLRAIAGWSGLRWFATAGLAAAVLLLIGTIVVPRVMLGPVDTGASMVVASDGTGDFDTIGDAVAAAAEGDTILVRPGTYLESILIDKDITLRGDGERERIVIRSPSEQADRWLPGDERAYAILLQDTDAHLENVTLTGPSSALIVHGGSPLISDLAVIDVGVANRPDDTESSRFAALELVDGSTAQVRDSVFRRSDIAVGEANVALEDNELEASMIRLFHTSGGVAGRTTLIRGNVISATRIAIWVDEGAAPRIEDNEISGAETAAAWIRFADPGTVVAGNTIHGSRTAFMIVESMVDLVENEVFGNEFGLNIAGPGTRVIENRIRDNTVGVLISSSSRGRPTSVTLEGNTVEENGRGVAIKAGTSSVLTGNIICDNETDLDVVAGAEVALEGNRICSADPSARAP